MKGEIITIGNELASGRTLDFNSWYVAGRLTASGLRITRITSVGDDPKRVSNALTKAIKESRFVIVTGGLGSTDDDITNEIVAKALNRPLCLDDQMYRQIKSHVESREMEMSASLEKMAWMPEGSKMLHPEGTACGFSLLEEDVYLYFLPGVPDQMRYLVDRFVLPELLSHFKTLPIMRQRMLKLYGLNEPAVAEMLKSLKGKTGRVVFGFYPHFPENHITFSLRGCDEPSVMKELDHVETEVRKLVGSYVFAAGNQSIEEVVGEKLRKRRKRISTAESCTGGLVGHRLTSVAGSSEYFTGGVVVYSNRSKKDLLGVTQENISAYGAVSGEVVREMASGVRKRLKSDMGLAITGIAGPEGGTKTKPVGTVFIGLADLDTIMSQKYRFWGTREQVKLSASMMALDWVRRYLDGDSFLPGI